MLTDWLIVRRLAAELDRALRGARIREVGRIADGRLGLRTPSGTIAIDAFGPTPIVALDDAAALERTAGWVRTMADLLEGLRVDRVRARRGDRLVAFECSARSRFGVESGYRLVAELVPRFGNILVLKDDTIVSAAKEFPRGRNARRSIVVGDPYEPPPLPEAAAGGPTVAEAFAAMLRDTTEAARARASAALRAEVPLVPRLVAESAVAEVAPLLAAGSVAGLAARAIGRARALVEAADGESAALGDVFAYRDGARLVQCHVVPLALYATLVEVRAAALMPLLAENVGGATRARAAGAFEARRASLRARVEKRRAAAASERAALERERDDASARDALRRAGDLLYAHLGDVPPHVRTFAPPSAPDVAIALDPELDAKGNAAAYFKRYRKATTKLAHVGARLADLAADEDAADHLAWELERAEPETLEDVAESVDRLDRRRGVVPKERVRKRKPLDVPLAADARVYVGRSPVGNADLTFRVARPDDLWFHARATPGAHVVLRIDSARTATPSELLAAASLAAFHSKARRSEKVSVDYTERKHVRRRPSGAPGLVWYTGARTLLVVPRDSNDAVAALR